MALYRLPMLDRLHIFFFGYVARVKITSWSWTYWWHASEATYEGDLIVVTDGIFCFKRRYTC